MDVCRGDFVGLRALLVFRKETPQWHTYENVQIGPTAAASACAPTSCRATAPNASSCLDYADIIMTKNDSAASTPHSSESRPAKKRWVLVSRHNEFKPILRPRRIFRKLRPPGEAFTTKGRLVIL